MVRNSSCQVDIGLKLKEDVRPVNAEFAGFYYDFPAQFNISDSIY